MLKGTKAIVWKDLKMTWRNPSLMVLSIIVPVVFVFLYSLITQVSATNPVVIARESEGEFSDRFVRMLTDMSSVDGPYFIVQTTDPDEAFRRYENGEAEALIEIPAAFDQDLKQRTSAPEVKLYVHNINSDATKNFQIRLSHAIYLFQQATAPEHNIEIVQQYAKFPRDVSMKLYISIGLLMFAVSYTSMVNTGMLIAREWEERTSKEIVLTSIGFLPFVLGKWITAFLQTLISVLFVLGIMSVTLSFPVTRMAPVLWFWIALLFLFGGAVGSMLGVWLRKSMPIITLSAVIGIFLYLVCGNESSIRGFAYGGPVEWLWRLSSRIPVSDVVENMRSTFLASAAAYEFKGLLFMLALTALFVFMAVFRLKRNLSYSQGQ
ncbi:MAG: ABC transporter permease [Paenibacillus macerans]|uniref:ABC transporter permease subunit n=1 Tax=Paenibacillus macerans TaxID=44252 RepID=A0A6N8F5P8_PAEMA|nr:ABC transporter permease [Paenibacillus macerans]MBS5912892.1 ABC transporter permease [Paenibacillus macerans]MDU7476515.1 ABC transporter permease [Paenibacillus macerans]MEC0140345.1 ABC transporter permease [Paenibacillus macerans]MUG25971.1 ABC transporter permease subunit [Paenibacillus macerans]GBK64592.1 ABC transporter permease [Paenibacillus macerans]